MKDKKQAALIEEQLLSSLVLGQEHYMLIDECSYTWDEAVERWFNEKKHLRTLKDLRRQAVWVSQHLGDSRKLHKIDTDSLRKLARIKTQASSAISANRHLSLIRAVLNKAHKEWGVLAKVPYVPMQKEDSRRIRYLSHDEADKLLTELPSHLHSMASFTLCTGLRASNVTGLTWSQIDLQRQHMFVSAEQSKSKKAIPVPLSNAAIDILGVTSPCVRCKAMMFCAKINNESNDYV